MVKEKVKILTVKPIMTDGEISAKEGELFPESHYKIILKENADIYTIDENNNKKLLLKFRKNVIPNEIATKAYNALEKHAQKKNYNRGASAGKLKLSKLPKHVGKITQKGNFRVFFKTKSGKTTNDNVGNMALSNIAGYYDRPDRNLYNSSNKEARKTIKSLSKNIKTDKNGVPLCRTTQFTANEIEKWENTVPLIKEADKLFKKLVPERYDIQYKRASITPNFQIDNTAYSTITINYNWRTALHKDKGDLEEGFGNLIVLEKTKSGFPDCKGYTGGYLGFPQYGVAVDVRQGDYLAMDVHQYHANTEIKGDGRLSVVCYLRKKMINCSKNNEIRN